MRRNPMMAMVCCLACLSLSGRVNAQFFDHSYAIVIGVDTYEFGSTWPALHYAVKDAKAMTDLLRSQGFTVIPLYGPDAKKAAIIYAMEDDLAPKLGPGDRVLVFFAGHGKTETLGGEKRGYIVPFDGNSGSSLISMSELKNQSSYMGAAKHQLFIMDSCYGGLLAATKDSIVDPHMPHYLKEVTDRIARQVLTAGGEGQTVLDGGPKGHSVFVDALLEGLQDGLADLNGDGYITFHELVAYVTPRASNDYETPGDGVLPGHQEGEFLFRNPKGAGRPVPEIPTSADFTRRSSPSAATAEQFLIVGNARWDAGDWDGAAAQYREAIRLKPDYAEAHDGLAIALDKKGDLNGSIQEDREAIRLKPDLAEAHYNLAIDLREKGDLNGAIQEEREAIRIKPDEAEAHYGLAIDLGNKGDLNGAIQEEREAIRIKPDYAEAHYGLGTDLGEKGDLNEAIQEEREAIRIKPDYEEAHYNLAIDLREKGDLNGSIQEDREAIRLKPDDAEAHDGLAIDLGEKGDLNGAIQEYHEAIRIKPDYAEAHHNLAIDLRGKGDLNEAIQEDREAIRIKPDYAEAHYGLAIGLTNKGDLNGSIQEEREAIRLKPDYADAHYGLAIDLETKGDRQSALNEYRQAFELRPGDADFQASYERLLKETTNSPR